MDVPLLLDNAKSVAHMPTAEQQQTRKNFKPRFKVDPAACPMPETRLGSQNASRPQRTSNVNSTFDIDEHAIKVAEIQRCEDQDMCMGHSAR